MTPWTKKQQTVALYFGGVVSLIAVTAAFLGFQGFKSVNVIAIMLFISALGIIVFVVGFIVGLFNKSPVWLKTKKVGMMLAAAPLGYMVLELCFPIL